MEFSLVEHLISNQLRRTMQFPSSGSSGFKGKRHLLSYRQLNLMARLQDDNSLPSIVETNAFYSQIQAIES
jgi:hypothetical protein